MFDYMMNERMLPHTTCPSCSARITFHGGYYPLEIVCGNCGQKIDLSEALNKLNYPNKKYNKDGTRDLDDALKDVKGDLDDALKDVKGEE